MKQGKVIHPNEPVTNSKLVSVLDLINRNVWQPQTRHTLEMGAALVEEMHESNVRQSELANEIYNLGMSVTGQVSDILHRLTAVDEKARKFSQKFPVARNKAARTSKKGGRPQRRTEESREERSFQDKRKDFQTTSPGRSVDPLPSSSDEETKTDSAGTVRYNKAPVRRKEQPLRVYDKDVTGARGISLADFLEQCKEESMCGADEASKGRLFIDTVLKYSKGRFRKTIKSFVLTDVLGRDCDPHNVSDKLVIEAYHRLYKHINELTCNGVPNEEKLDGLISAVQDFKMSDAETFFESYDRLRELWAEADTELQKTQ